MAWISVDVELDEFSDEDIKEEYEARKLGNNSDPDEQCQRAYTLHHQGRKDEAYAILWELCLDRVNKII
jgi:bacillopeptidase F (M6 metalloprotease family)